MAIALLGATGSIGASTCKVARQHGLPLVAVASRRASPQLAALCREFRPRLVAVADREAAKALADFGLPPETALVWGHEALLAVATHPDADTVVVAIPGLQGLAPTLAACQAAKRVLTANKETLVAGGELLQEAIQAGQLVSIDSEHAALAQLLACGREGVRELILTASGGPFLDRDEEELRRVTVEEALCHPTWRMGPKVSIDSATLMNKGLEVIEAHVLFTVPYERIRVVVHRQSIVHALIRYQDETLLAQLSQPDMTLPIQWALFGGERRASGASPLDLEDLALHFQRLPPGKDRALRLAYQAGRAGGTKPAELSAANEVAVEAFLCGQLPFVAILSLVDATLDRLPPGPSQIRDLDELLAADARARDVARALLREGVGRC